MYSVSHYLTTSNRCNSTVQLKPLFYRYRLSDEHSAKHHDTIRATRACEKDSFTEEIIYSAPFSIFTSFLLVYISFHTTPRLVGLLVLRFTTKTSHRCTCSCFTEFLASSGPSCYHHLTIAAVWVILFSFQYLCSVLATFCYFSKIIFRRTS